MGWHRNWLRSKGAKDAKGASFFGISPLPVRMASIPYTDRSYVPNMGNALRIGLV